MVDRVKPWLMVWLMVQESWFCSWFGIPLRPLKTVLNNVLLEHVGLHCVLPYAVHPDLGHPPVTQEYLGLLSEPFNTTQTF